MKLRIASASQMREIDRRAIEETGIPGIVLMENAGRAAVDVMEKYFSDFFIHRIAVICGKGNNGGDGFVVARHLWNQGGDVILLLLAERKELSGDAATNADIASKMGIPLIEFSNSDDVQEIESLLSNADIVVDAILGTGIKSGVRGIYSEVIQLINESEAFIVSLDIPSGLSADQSSLPGLAVSADLTVTFGLPKPSLLLYPAAQFTGQLITVDISIPRSVVDSLELSGDILCPEHFPAFFSPRPRNSHKGTYGHLLIIAGSPGKTGAAVLAAEAALKAGAGLVTVAVPEPLNLVLESKLTEVMTLPLPGNHNYLHPDHLEVLQEATVGKSALLIGPGLGTELCVAECLKGLLQEIGVPLILDADALNIVASTPGPWFKSGVPVILTPHPGEFSRLVDLPPDQILREQLDLVPEFSTTNSCIMVFKTARTIIAFPEGRYLVNTTGNPGMASGGSGDVLSGMISGLTSRGIIPEQAVAAGVFWHGFAGDIAAMSIGEEEMVAGDIIQFMNKARVYIQENPEFFNGSCIPYPDIQI